MKKSIFILSLLICSIIHMGLAQDSSPDKANVFVKIKNIKKLKGNIMVAVYNSEDQFMEERYRSEIVPVEQTGETVLCLKGVPAGTYAVAVFHDENENRELDSNLVGIPKEAYGFSNDAKGSFGPPSFKEASFKVGVGNVEIAIGLHKLLTD